MNTALLMPFSRRLLLADLPEDLPLPTLIVGGEACSADVACALVARAGG